MNQEKIQEFTRRLSQCNRGGMILIMYEIVFAYLDDAKNALEQKNHEEYKHSMRKAQESLRELCNALDFSYEISKNLYALYVYCRNELAKAMYEARGERIVEVEGILRRLYASFEVAAKQDTSGPLMSNTQQVYAGMTYGRNNQLENYMEIDSHRGFLV